MKITTVKPNSPQGDLLDELLDKFSKDLAKEIDFDAMVELRNARGWTLVELTPFTSRNLLAAEWARNHVAGQWDYGGSLSNKFIFERAEDATAFLLKWK